MGDFSRDSFRQTQNILNILRQRQTPSTDHPRHYVSARLQQGVPVLDADINEMDDIRRFELETILARAIGTGVPAGSDGFRISAIPSANDLRIAAGLMFVDGCLVLNQNDVRYTTQPHRNIPELEPPLDMPIADTPLARRELVYLDVWDREVDSYEDGALVDPRIGLETCVRLERVWVVRSQVIDGDADPFDPMIIETRIAEHRYCPLATLDRTPGGQISARMITDLRRTHLSLDRLTHPPLHVYDPVRDQRCDAERLACVFSDNLAALDDVYEEAQDAFVFPTFPAETWHTMNRYQDIRAMAIAFEQEAMRDQLSVNGAMTLMARFYAMQRRLSDYLNTLVLPPADGGIDAGESAQNFLAQYDLYLYQQPESLAAAVSDDDFLGAVLAQERINHEIASLGGSRLDGTVSLSLITVTPNEPLAAGHQYILTLRLTSQLYSDAGEEDIWIEADAGDWEAAFEETLEEDAATIRLNLENHTTTDVPLRLTVRAGASPTTLRLKAYPDRRKLRVFRMPDIALAIGDRIIPEEGVIAGLECTQPGLTPDNVLNVPGAVIGTLLPLPFNVTNLGEAENTFVLTVIPDGDAAEWVFDERHSLSPFSTGETRPYNVDLRVNDVAAADSPQTFTFQLARTVDGGDEEPLEYTAITITFNLT